MALCAGALLLPALSSSKSAASRADAPLVGVPGRTSGSQTFLRVRPSALTPPVAKVPSGTSVYVWGRYQDWYRVETKDHLFGWVHKKYIDARHLRKVREISHFKAKQASDKGSHQTLFGTPSELKTYYARYGGKGAVKGLALKGVYLPVKKQSAPLRLAKAPVAKRPTLGRKPAVRVAMNTRRNTQRLAPTALPSTLSGGTLLSPPTPQELGTDRSAGEDLRVAPDAMAPDASSLAKGVKGWKPASATTPQQPIAPPRVAVAPPQTMVVPSRMAIASPIAPKKEAPRVAVGNSEAGVPLAPVLPDRMALLSPAQASPNFIKRSSAKPSSQEQSHILAWQARKRAKEQRWKWLQARKVNDWKYRQVQAQHRATIAANRRQYLAKLRESRHIYLASRRGKEREYLGAKVGLAPKQLPANVPGGTLAPISPEEIMRERARFLKEHPAVSVPLASSQGAPDSSDTGTPLQPSGLSSPAPTGVLPRKLDALLFGSPSQKSQTAQELSVSSASGEQIGQAAANLGEPTSSMPVPFPVPSAPSSVSSGAAPSRGGSPRDRAAQSWNSGVASQALSYRGMPYRFGAASPRSGFDCSGLIYYLLRQRGLNPPRTAAGYRTYGHPVARGKWQTGDLILFANTYKHGISHIGVYLKDGKFVHAASTRQGVRVDSLYTGYFANKYWGARRVK